MLFNYAFLMLQKADYAKRNASIMGPKPKAESVFRFRFVLLNRKSDQKKGSVSVYWRKPTRNRPSKTAFGFRFATNPVKNMYQTRWAGKQS